MNTSDIIVLGLINISSHQANISTYQLLVLTDDDNDSHDDDGVYVSTIYISTILRLRRYRNGV
jgi:hypothetical protein